MMLEQIEQRLRNLRGLRRIVTTARERVSGIVSGGGFRMGIRIDPEMKARILEAGRRHGFDGYHGAIEGCLRVGLGILEEADDTAETSRVERLRP